MYKKILKLTAPLICTISLIVLCNDAKEKKSTEGTYLEVIKPLVDKKLATWEDIKHGKNLRILVTPSRTNFFIAKDKARGFEYEMFEELEKDLQKSLELKNFQVTYIPVAHNKLISSLMQGYGDVAAALLTITPERQKLIDFSSPYFQGISEVLLRHKSAPPVKSMEDLSGKEVFVADGSSYLSSLKKLNRRLASENIAPVNIITLDELNTGDVLELLNTGLFHYTFADHNLAELWKSVLPNILIDPEIQIGKNKEIAWAIRKNSPQLKAHLDRFAQKHRQGSLLGNIFFKRYYQRPYWVDNALLSNLGKLEKYKKFFQEAAEKYDLNWVFLAMQAYQESSLNPNAKSHAGAIGIMQLLPSTAKDMGVKDIYDPYQNIMGGAKYLDWIRARYFSDLPKDEQLCFYLAAYNAGFRTVQNWRKDAKSLGYNPNIWFGHVEHVALQKTGLEPVRYVSNITKAFTAISQYYKIAAEKAKLIEDAKEKVGKIGK
ncbi:amino-acid abc transporter binding protein [Lentisphaera araneosa HTCC2155]|uniref:Amino-acid abc transporter binding protein n=1 Tax=Lentisphaera araneosa HTCC2155 TaxID=313628 RepID=A6DS82_9BACT|nr:amino-acid abc transporter binding protein [Lentisphaera araneosa HTCC2155]